MDILFLSAFPDSYYQTVTSLNPKEVSPAAQKYNHLLLKGLQENGANVTVLCTRDPLSKLEKTGSCMRLRPITRAVCRIIGVHLPGSSR